MRATWLVGLLALTPVLCSAAELEGGTLSPMWAIPFAGLLLSIALGPLLMPQFWHHHYGKVALGWMLAFLLPCSLIFDWHTAVHVSLHAFITEFLPFLILISTLFVVAGGICVRGNLHGAPGLNTGLLALGTLLASVMGTTGASMLLIRPLMRANDHRRHATHTVVFFIFLVANAGGALTPLGDPPLFLGFLKGVDFFWTTRHMFMPALFLCASLLIIFYLLDSHYYHKKEEIPPTADPTPDSALRFEGKFNFILLAAVIILVLLSGFWKPGISFLIFGQHVELQNLVRDVSLLVIIGLSLYMTPDSAHRGNEFSWEPIKEVGKLFAGIFITIIPVIAMLRAGQHGAFSAVIHAVTDGNGQPINMMYFWACGLLSSFLDNAPTYLVFFNTAGGDAQALMTTMATTLTAISCGAVFMGANSYIGNAPNMMVKSIAEKRGIQMPSFFAYMMWSGIVLVPLFVVMSFLFF